MGIFDFLKKQIEHSQALYVDASDIDEEEKKYYQSDDYYVLIKNKGMPGFEVRVIPFEERKKISYPSNRGLYVAEILLLEYCSYGTYPKPANGYPGFWWFDYGIRNVAKYLSSLEQRGFIQWSPKVNLLKTLSLSDLKEILKESGLAVSGKKEDLVSRIRDNIPENKWENRFPYNKYELTELGFAELKDNEYVVYMHKHDKRTMEDSTFGESFTVWDMNNLIAKNHQQANWRKIIGDIEQTRFGVNVAENLDNTKKVETVKLSAEEIREYLNIKKEYINEQAKTSGDGYTEEMKGIDYKKLGNDKEAIVEFYISIEKRFDAPALYENTAILLRKYKLYEEELYVLDMGLKNVSEGNIHYVELCERKEKLLKLMSKRC